MAIVIQQILGDTADGVRAVVMHEWERLEADVVGTRAQAEANVGVSLQTEMGCDDVVSHRVLATDDRDAHGIFSSEGGVLRLVGQVFAVHEGENGQDLFDVYVTKGPEYILVSSKELTGELPREGSGIELMLRGLRFYPTWH